MATDQESQLNQAGVHLEPRGPDQYPPPTNPNQQPTKAPRYKDSCVPYYPSWVTLLTRGPLAAFEIAALGYTIWFIKKWESNAEFIKTDKKEDCNLAIAALSIALAVDLFACILTALGIYAKGGWWILALIGDGVVGGVGILGAITLFWVDHNGFSREELGWFWEEDAYLIATFVVVIGFVCPHFLLSHLW